MPRTIDATCQHCASLDSYRLILITCSVLNTNAYESAFAPSRNSGYRYRLVLLPFRFSLATLLCMRRPLLLLHGAADRGWRPKRCSGGNLPFRYRAACTPRPPCGIQLGNERHASFRCARLYNDSVFSSAPCAIAVWLGHGLNTILGPQVRSNAGSPTSVGRPAKYKTLLPFVGAGNTWGVVTSVPACSTVPATGD